MLTKEMYRIAMKLEELRVIYINMSEDTAYTLYEMCNGNLELMEKTLDLACDHMIEENTIIQFFEAINNNNLDEYLNNLYPIDED